LLSFAPKAIWTWLIRVGDGWAALGNGIDVTIFFTFWGLDMINKHRQARLEIAPVANPA
jgi:peroxiredoxin family protein